jgi:hypothetical protein
VEVHSQNPDLDRYDVALWDTLNGFLVMVERKIEEDPDPEAPMLSIEEAHARGGWIARTFLWKVGIRARTLTCGPAEISIPEIPSQTRLLEKWTRNIHLEIMVESVRLTITGALGGEVLEIFRKLRRLAPR